MHYTLDMSTFHVVIAGSNLLPLFPDLETIVKAGMGCVCWIGSVWRQHMEWVQTKPWGHREFLEHFIGIDVSGNKNGLVPSGHRWLKTKLCAWSLNMDMNMKYDGKICFFWLNLLFFIPVTLHSSIVDWFSSTVLAMGFSRRILFSLLAISSAIDDGSLSEGCIICPFIRVLCLSTDSSPIEFFLILALQQMWICNAPEKVHLYGVGLQGE